MSHHAPVRSAATAVLDEANDTIGVASRLPTAACTRVCWYGATAASPVPHDGSGAPASSSNRLSVESSTESVGAAGTYSATRTSVTKPAEDTATVAVCSPGWAWASLSVTVHAAPSSAKSAACAAASTGSVAAHEGALATLVATSTRSSLLSNSAASA